jgi:hypothetical protein
MRACPPADVPSLPPACALVMRRTATIPPAARAFTTVQQPELPVTSMMVSVASRSGRGVPRAISEHCDSSSMGAEQEPGKPGLHMPDVMAGKSRSQRATTFLTSLQAGAGIHQWRVVPNGAWFRFAARRWGGGVVRGPHPCRHVLACGTPHAGPLLRVKGGQRMLRWCCE